MKLFQIKRCSWRVAFLMVSMLVQGLYAGQIENVLFIVADDLRANVLGCYGDKTCQTPNIDRLAESGLVFERAYCQGTSCGPSRRSFMHSRYFGTGGKNFGEHLRVNGWYTARVGKIYHMRVPGDIIGGTHGEDLASSWTERFNAPGREAHTAGDYACLNLNVFSSAATNRQSTRMPHRPFVSVVSDGDGDGSDQPDYKAASQAIRLLRQRLKMRQQRGERFFLAVGFVRPHYPMVAPAEYFDRYPHQGIQIPKVSPGDLEDIPKVGWGKSTDESNGIGRYPENKRRMWAAYYAAVSFMDTQVGRVLDALDELGLRESTMIIFTSDHGYHLGDHGFWQKTNLHEQVIRVPLIVSGQGYERGSTHSLVELADIYPTACDAVELEVPATAQGESLLPILHDKSVRVREAALTIQRNSYSIRTERWHYIRYSNGAEELYDAQLDPEEIENLAQGNSSTLETLQSCRKLLDQKLSSVRGD